MTKILRNQNEKKKNEEHSIDLFRKQDGTS